MCGKYDKYIKSVFCWCLKEMLDKLLWLKSFKLCIQIAHEHTCILYVQFCCIQEKILGNFSLGRPSMLWGDLRPCIMVEFRIFSTETCGSVSNFQILGFCIRRLFRCIIITLQFLLIPEDLWRRKRTHKFWSFLSGILIFTSSLETRHYFTYI